MRILIAETTWAAMAAAKDLHDAGFRLTRADTAADAVDFAGLAEHDAILINDDLPDMDGLACLRILRRRHPRCAIVMLTTRGDCAARLRALDAGADDAIPAGTDRRELVARVQAVARRRAGLAEPVIRIGNLTVDCATRQVLVGEKPLRLTPVEFELVECLALRAGSVVASEALMNHLYGFDEDAPDPKIVTVYVCHIRAKIAKAGGDASVIETVWGRGYALFDTRPLRIAA